MKSAPLQGRFSQNGAGTTSRAGSNEQYSLNPKLPLSRGGALVVKEEQQARTGKTAPRDF